MCVQTGGGGKKVFARGVGELVSMGMERATCLLFRGEEGARAPPEELGDLRGARGAILLFLRAILGSVAAGSTAARRAAVEPPLADQRLLEPWVGGGGWGWVGVGGGGWGWG